MDGDIRIYVHDRLATDGKLEKSPQKVPGDIIRVIEWQAMLKAVYAFHLIQMHAFTKPTRLKRRSCMLYSILSRTILGLQRRRGGELFRWPTTSNASCLGAMSSH